MRAVTNTRHRTLQAAPPLAAGLVLGLAAAVLAAHLVANAVTPYGFHRDEFLYVAMGRHLRLFRMDVPPFIALAAEAVRPFGDSVFVLRLLPAVTGAALVVLAALLARVFGGGRYAQGLAGLAVATVPLFLRAASLFQPVVFDQLWWTSGFLALAHLCRADEAARTRWWLVLGVAAGLGLLTKLSVLFWGLGVLAGLVATPHRGVLATRGPWLALAVALVLGSPTLVGQVRLDFPVFGQMAALGDAQLERVSYLDFVAGQGLMLGPAFLLAVLGLAALLRNRTYRPVGVAVAVAFVVVMLMHGKPYYIGPVYPALFGAGAAALERWTARLEARHAARAAFAVRGTAVALVAAFGMLVLPMGLPVLPPAPMARYAAALGVSEAVTTNQGVVLELPQDYADMLGWEEQVAAVARVYHALPPGERAEAVIVAGNYGEAGAVDLLGPRHGLPPAVFPESSYWYFGPGEKPGRVIVKIGGTAEELKPFCRSLALAARVDTPWVVPEERNLPIWICRSPYRTLQEIWPDFAGRF